MLYKVSILWYDDKKVVHFMSNEQNPFDAAQAALQQSWEVHRQAFGPILEPAFVENPQVRITLIAALNHISRREIQRGMELLKQIKEFCVYDEDKAAWTFFVGLCFEMGGAKEQMLKWYADAGKFNHRFYLPYLKLAKAAHSSGAFEAAKGYYETAIECLLEMPENDRDDIILGSACTNLTSCLTMLHQYEAAERAWIAAQRFPAQPGAAATGAILYAAMGNTDKVAELMEQLKQTLPAWVAQTQEMTQAILNGTHPAFQRE